MFTFYSFPDSFPKKWDNTKEISFKHASSPLVLRIVFL